MPDNNIDGTGRSSGVEDIGYGEALAEIDDILGQIDDPDLDVDLLGARVRRATVLIEHCRNRLAAARLDVTLVTTSPDGAAAATAPEEPEDPTHANPTVQK